MTTSEYWTNRLAGAPDISLARDPNKHCEFIRASIKREYELSPSEWDNLPSAELERQAFLLAALYVLVYKHAGRPDTIIAVKSGNEADATLMPLRTDVDASLGFREYAAIVQQRLGEAVQHLDQLHEIAWIPRIGFEQNSVLSASPKWQEMVSEVYLQVRCQSQRVSSCLNYDASRFTETAAKRLLDGYHCVLKQALGGNPAIRAIDVISDTDKQLILGPFNDTDTDFVGQTFHGLFEAQVRRVPESVALVDESVTLTYSQANERANQIAHALIAKGVRRNDVVGVIIGRSVHALVGMLGIMKAGAAYLPIEPGFPQERTNYMLVHSRCAFALTDTASMSKVPPSVTAIDVSAHSSAEMPTSDPGLDVALSDLAYVIYTSGSTGEPKGVPIHHEGVANLHHIFRDRFAISEFDKMTEFASFSFDTSVWEIVMCILSGASLHILSDALKANYANLERYLAQHQITVATFPPTYLSYMNPEHTPSLRKVMVAGSECSAKLLRQWNDRVDFYNAYGPTEHSVCIAVFNAPKGKLDVDTVPIGRPLFNKRIYIVGVDGQLQPIGAPGELWVSGVGTSTGYLSQLELTRDRFISNPFPGPAQGPRAGKHTIVYRTGDLARWREDGCIEFIGRLDNQVKVRGYRIELDEVDSALLKVPGIIQAGSIVKKDKDADGSNILVGFYTSSATLAPEVVRESLAARVPDFIIPSRIVQIDTMPMTNSDKVDRKALAALSEDLVDSSAITAPTSSGNMTVDFIKSITASVLGRPVVADQWREGTRLQTLGVDSLQFMKIVVGIEDQFNVEFEDDFLLDGRSMTLVEIAQLIEDRMSP
jgi:amino acid adenylation domain-containing protein